MKREKTIKFLRQAQRFANIFSKDQSTKVGAIFTNPRDYTVLTRGYNGMPRGVTESPERHERPLKYSFFEHAERNAIYNLARTKLKGSIAVTTSVPGLSDVRALLSVGVSEVVCPEQSEHDTDTFEIVCALFRETGVALRTCKDGSFSVVLQGSHTPGCIERHHRKMAGFMEMAQSIRLEMCKDLFGNATLFLSREDYTQLSEGYSGMPRGADDSRTERYSGRARDVWVEQSVRNAIYNSVRAELAGSTALVTATTCVECARAIISVGAAEVQYVEPAAEFKARWAESMASALVILEELGVRVTAISREELEPE